MTQIIPAKTNYDFKGQVVEEIFQLVKGSSSIPWLMAMRDSLQHNAMQYYIAYGYDLDSRSYWLKKVHESHKLYFYLSKYVCGTSREAYNHECMIVLNSACYTATRYFDFGSPAYERVFQLLTKQNIQLAEYRQSVAGGEEA